MKKVVSFSGGRTSAYLSHLMIDKYGRENVEFVFMDTVAEHPKTYDFIKSVNLEFKLNLTCLRVVFNEELGKGNGYKIIDISEIKNDLIPWREMMKKYGTPYNPGGSFCTGMMKLGPWTKYLNEKYGKNNYESYLGIRIDEPKRLKPRENVVYMADISDFEKQDVLDWWEERSFNLEIPEHLGNCVFCIKKGINKVALAERDEPMLGREFMDEITSSWVREVEGRKAGKLDMYRGKNSFGDVIKIFSDHSRDDIEMTIRGRKQYESGSCTESCEVFNDEAQLDFDF